MTISSFADATVSAGGLCGPAVASLLLFVLARRGKWARIGLGLLAAFFTVALVMVVRNLLGFVFVTSLVLVLVALLKWGSDKVAQLSLLFVAINLASSVFTRSDYLFTPVANMASGPQPSDVANMSKQLFLPYWFWGVLCGAFSVLLLLLGVWLYLRPSRSSSPKELAA